MAQKKTTQPAPAPTPAPTSAPYGFPEIEPLPSRNWWEPSQGPATLPSRPMPDFNMYPSQTPAMDAYYEGAMNPPVKEKASKLRMLGTGLLSALQGSTGHESRQPVYNAAGKVIGSREAGFWESLGNKPFDVDEAKHILDMPHEAKVEDYERGMKGLGAAATIESNYPSKQALAMQRMAAAQAKPREVAVKEGQLQRQNYLASLKLSDEEAELLRQEGRLSLEDARAINAMNRVNAQQAGATTRVGMQQTGATERVGMQQEGAMERVQEQQAGGLERANVMAGAGITRAGMNTGGVVMAQDPATGQQRAYRVNPDNPAELLPMQIQGQPSGQPVPNVIRPGVQKTGESNDEALKLQSVREIASRTDTALGALLNPDNTLRDDVKWAVGGSKWSGIVPGTQAATGKAKVGQARNLLTLELMQEIRKISASGATGLGNMSNKDRETLQQAASILSTDLREEDFLAEVLRIRPLLQKIQEPTPGTQKIPGSTTPMTPEERIRRSRANRAGRK